MPSIQSIIDEYKEALKDIYPLEEISSISLLVLEEISTFPKTFILSNKNYEIEQKQYKEVKCILERLKKAEPIQQILAKVQFLDLQLKINKHVLIPRQETEELVSIVLGKVNPKNPASILEIGTGSGCIAISLKKNLPNTKIKAIDIDENAIKLAKENADIHNLEIAFKQLNFLEKINCNKNCLFDIIVSNPPYVMEKEKKMMHQNVLNFEPHKALFVPDSHPLIFYDAIQKYASKHLSNKGMIFLEINEALGSETLNLFSEEEYIEKELIKDLNGKDRFIFVRKK